MKSPRLASELIAFGPFEVNTRACEVRKQGVRVRLSGQPFQILVTLLGRAGEVVTREELREEIWAQTTFVDFEHGLNAAINKLRRALEDSAEHPRFIETVPGRGYRFIAGLNRPPVREESDPLAAASNDGERHRQGVSRWLGVLAVILIVLVIVIAVALRQQTASTSATLPDWKMIRLTADSGLSSTPALSPDGKLVAYSSDREKAGKQDVYLQQVAGGQPIRLTFDGEGNNTPDFSPDGSKIVFRSNRNGGGIYEVPAFGGEARLLAGDGFDPKYSRDGRRVAYWVGARNIAQAVPGNGTVWVVPVSGGQPRRIAPNLTSARGPIWSADGRHVLVVGYASKAAYDGSALDWWLVPADGATASRTGAYDAMARAGLRSRDVAGSFSLTIPIPNLPAPRCWSAGDNTIVFSLENGDTNNLWATGISGTGVVSGPFRRLTAGAGNEVEPSCASNGAIAFTNVEHRHQVWSAPLDFDTGTAAGALERVTHGLSRREYPSLSGDGRHLAFVSAQSGRLSIWMRNLSTGNEWRLAASPFVQRYPELSRSGAKVAFSSYERDKRAVYVTEGNRPPVMLCEDCLRATDWSHDEKRILVVGGDPYRISSLDIASRVQTPLLVHGSNHVLYGRFSPDNRWISFTVRRAANRAWIAIAPVREPSPMPETAWINVSEEGPEDRANWSPDGRTLYFTSSRDGYTCMWGQRIDTVSHTPVGQPFAARHFHERLVLQQLGWSIGGGRVAFALRESTGNIWMMSTSVAP